MNFKIIKSDRKGNHAFHMIFCIYVSLHLPTSKRIAKRIKPVNSINFVILKLFLRKGSKLSIFDAKLLIAEPRDKLAAES